MSCTRKDHGSRPPNLVQGFMLDNETSINENDTKVQVEFLLDPSYTKIIVVTIMIDPKSRGSITLQSPDPNIDPIINPAYSFEHGVYVRGIEKIVKSIINSEILKTEWDKICSKYYTSMWISK